MGSGGGEAIAAAAAFEPQETPLQPLQQQPAAPPPPQQQQQHLLLQAEELEALDATTLELPLPDTMVLAPAEVRWRRRRLRTMVTELSNPVRVPGPPATIPSAAGWDYARVKPPRPAVVLKQKRPRIRGFESEDSTHQSNVDPCPTPAQRPTGRADDPARHDAAGGAQPPGGVAYARGDGQQ